MADIRHSIQITAKPETVYPLIATSRGLSQWWAEDITSSAAGAELGFFNRATVYRLKLNIDDPPLRAEWLCETGVEWSGTHITFRLEARGSSTVVHFTHGAWQAETDYFRSCNTTWGELMFRLKAAAENKSRGPLFRTSDLAY